jgi:hypothetical protein
MEEKTIINVHDIAKLMHEEYPMLEFKYVKRLCSLITIAIVWFIKANMMISFSQRRYSATILSRPYLNSKDMFKINHTRLKLADSAIESIKRIVQ